MKWMFLFLLIFISRLVQACPFCKSPAAVEIRASLFGEDFTYNLFISILPFLVFSIIIYLIYHGGIPYKKRNKV